MIKSFFKDSFIYGLGGFLTYGISVLLVPIYTRIFSPADYAIIDIFTIATSFINVSLALEISQGLARYYSEAQTKDEQIAYASSAFWFTLIVYSAFLLMCWLVSQPLSSLLFGRDDLSTVFRIASLAVFSGAILYLVQNQLRWQLQPKRYSVTSLVATFSSILMSILFVVVLRVGLVGVFLGQFIGYTLATLTSLYFAREVYRFTFDWTRFKRMLRFSLPLVPSSVMVVVNLYADRIVIRELLTLADLGLFGVAYRVVSVMNLFLFGFQAALTPLIYTHYAEPTTPHQFARIFSHFLALSLLGIIGLSLFIREAAIVLLPPDYLPAVSLVPILAPAVLLNSMYIFAPGLFIAKKTQIISIISIVGGVFNLLLSFVFVPFFGVQGAGLGTLVTSSTTFLIYMILSQRLYPVPHRWISLIGALLWSIAVIVVGMSLQLPILISITVKLLFVLVTLVMFFRLRIIEREFFFNLWLRVKQRALGTT